MYRFQEKIDSCIDCKKCWDVCPANMVTEGNRFTPQGKIKSLAKIVAGEELTQDEMDNINLSTHCSLFLIDNGPLEEAAEHAKKFVDYIESLGVKKVLVSFPGCYIVLSREYPDLYRKLDFDVEYSLNIFRDMINDGILKPKKLDYTVSIRDTVHLET
ncbi:(Fe-S)-binding protein [Methanohalophilus sp.]